MKDDELLNRIEHSNGLEFVGWDEIVTLRDALTAHLSVTRNPYIYDTSTPATFTPPKSMEFWDALRKTR